jgi:hypothetical protein
MNAIPTKTQHNKCYFSLSFAVLSVVAAVALVILPMAALVFNFVWL